MKKYRYIGAFPLIIRSADGSFNQVLHYGEEFETKTKLEHPLIVEIKIEGDNNE